MNEFGILLKIKSARKSRFGDYRAPHHNKPATISINNDLNQYHFLITLVHEIAHASVWQQFKRSARPHGKEWQMEYRKKLSAIISLSVFPIELTEVLDKHLQNVKASTCSDQKLYRKLRIYDQPNSYVLLSEIGKDTVFELKGGRRFIKGEKRRTRYLCRELDGKRNYTISASAEVKPLIASGETRLPKLSA